MGKHERARWILPSTACKAWGYADPRFALQPSPDPSVPVHIHKPPLITRDIQDGTQDGETDEADLAEFSLKCSQRCIHAQ